MVGYRKKGVSEENQRKQWKEREQRRKIKKSEECRSKHEIGTKAYNKCMTGGDPVARKSPVAAKKPKY